MVEGMNMGRKCPWTKAELKSLYDRLETYTKALTMRLVATEGIKSSMEAMRAYNMLNILLCMFLRTIIMGDSKTSE